MLTNKLWIVAWREYSYNFRRPSYLFSAFIMPLAIAALMFFLVYLMDEPISEGDFSSVGYVDRSEARILAGVDDVPEPFRAYDDLELLQAAFREGTIDAYFVVSPDYLENGGYVDFYAADGDISQDLRQDMAEFLTMALASLSPDPRLAERVQSPLEIERVHLLNDGRSFDNVEAFFGAFLAQLLIPVGFSFFLFISVTISAQFLMSSVIEEKENRMIEILASSCTPRDLILGKLVGLGGIALTQILIWTGLVIVSGQWQQEVADLLSYGDLGLDDLLWFIGLYLLSFLFFAALAMTIASIVSAEQEARQFSIVSSLLAILPIVAIPTFLEVNHPLAIILVIFPFSAPLAILLASAYGAVSQGVIWLGVGVLVLAIVAVNALAVRLFRAGMLQYGQQLGWRFVWRLIRGLA